MIKAEIICDSKTTTGDRLTTFVVTFPRIVLAEFNTHRAFSRNSASSRAIPFKKMLKMVMKNPFIPIKWMKDHKGMQGSDYFSGWRVWLLTQLWLTARNVAVLMAIVLSWLGLTKQIVNRLLEPFMWHTAIVTASEWQNFFALRAHEAAEIHIQELAYQMLQAYNTSEPKLLQPGEWHLPFGDNIPHLQYVKEGLITGLNGVTTTVTKLIIQLKVATARCARVSYLTHDGVRDLSKDIEMHDRLAISGHWSPFEHCAEAMVSELYSTDGPGQPIYPDRWCGNFRGFVQYRKTFATENKKDSRVK